MDDDDDNVGAVICVTLGARPWLISYRWFGSNSERSNGFWALRLKPVSYTAVAIGSVSEVWIWNFAWFVFAVADDILRNDKYIAGPSVHRSVSQSG